MAPRTFIGKDGNGRACFKVFKDAADDPLTTPDTDRNKFHYNSNDDTFPEANRFIDALTPAAAGASGYLPSGTGVDDYDVYYTNGDGGNPASTSRAFSDSYFEDLDYLNPFHSYVYQKPNGRYFQGTLFQRDRGFGGIGGTVSVNQGYGYDGSALSIRQNVRTNDYDNFINVFTGLKTVFTRQVSSLKYDALANFYTKALVWNLPGDDVTSIVETPHGTPVPWQKTISINPSEFKIAKAGYDVATATRNQLVFDANKRPAKVIASGDVQVPGSGAYTVDLGYTVGADTIAIVHYYPVGGDIYYPAHPLLAVTGCEYYFSGSDMIFVNLSATACRARYFVLAFDSSEPTTGSNKVFRQINVDGEEVVQYLRPGSAEPPELADIIIDSRWPTLHLLKSGYIAVGTGELTHTVTFANPSGMKPLVLYNTINLLTNLSNRKVQTSPFTALLKIDNIHTGDSTYAKIASSNTQVDFYTHRGNAADSYRTDSNPFNITYEASTAVVVGLRYYIFGIPT